MASQDSERHELDADCHLCGRTFRLGKGNGFVVEIDDPIPICMRCGNLVDVEYKAKLKRLAAINEENRWRA